MTTPQQIGWGSYMGDEGPFFGGTERFHLPAMLTDNDKVLAVITATEGGHFDAINMYDRMIISVGVIQWGEAGIYAVSDMLGAVGEADPSLLAPLKSAFEQSATSFRKNAKGQWRFFFNDDRGEVNTLPEQQQLFLLNSTGAKGTWDDASRDYAKVWAACVANVFAQPVAQAVQVDFTMKRTSWFVLGDAKAALWGPSDPVTNDGWVGALRAGYLSFAANLPVVANAQLKVALSNMDPSVAKWSPEWCITILRQLTFGPNIAIYPGRYNAIRPVLESLFEVDVPDLASDLQRWHTDNNIVPVNGVPSFTSTKEVQQELLAEGYDLGPAGADGIYGPKTTAAVLIFQGTHGLPKTGIVDQATRRALDSEWETRTD